MTTTLNAYDLHHGTDYGTVWDALESQVLYVLDERGVCMSNGQVRHLMGKYWLYLDDQDGYAIVNASTVEGWYLSDTDPKLGYDRNGEVVSL